MVGAIHRIAQSLLRRTTRTIALVVPFASSRWLHERGVLLHKISVPAHMGDVHYKTLSFKSPGALVSRTDTEESGKESGGSHAKEWNDAGRTRRLLNAAMGALRVRVRGAGADDRQGQGRCVGPTYTTRVA